MSHSFQVPDDLMISIQSLPPMLLDVGKALTCSLWT